MARNHARVLTAIWTDQDFCALPGDAQRIYLLLLSQSDLTPCGALPYLPARWARLSPDTTAEDVVAAVSTLEDARYLVVDRDTQELIIRTFVIHDGGLNNTKMRGAVKSALVALHSMLLRCEIVDVLPDEYRSEIVDRLPIERRSNVVPGAAGTPMGSNAEVGGRRQSPVSSTSESSSPRAETQRGSRLPEDFDITDPMLEWAEQRTPGLDLVHHTERFVNYWTSKPGKNGTQLDWPATWRNWMLKEYAARPIVPKLAAVYPTSFKPWTCSVGNPECRDGWVDTDRGAAECECRRQKASSA